MRALAAISVCALAVAGCIPTPRVGTFAADAVYMVRDHYRVSYVAGGALDLLGADWTLENYETSADGVGPARWTRDSTRSVSLEGESAEVIERFDLRLTHSSDHTMLFAQTTPLPSNLGERALDAVARELVGRVAALHAFNVDWTSEPAPEHADTAVRAQGPVVVDGVAGYWTTFDLDLEGRATERITLVIVRPSARWTRAPRAHAPDAGDGWPMLVVFGYVSGVEHHGAHRSELEDLLRRVDFHETP